MRWKVRAKEMWAAWGRERGRWEVGEERKGVGGVIGVNERLRDEVVEVGEPLVQVVACEVDLSVAGAIQAEGKDVDVQGNGDGVEEGEVGEVGEVGVGDPRALKGAEGGGGVEEEREEEREAKDSE